MSFADTSTILYEELVGPLLRKKGLKLVVAESCTGGLIGDRITNVPGSSDYYLGSITAYAYEAKERLLGIDHERLQQFGAVSREIVLDMACGARRMLAQDFGLDKVVGIAVSGIAGPGGGLPGKPVGLVYMGLSAPENDWSFKFLWNGSRIENKQATAHAALRILITYLEGHFELLDSYRTYPPQAGRG